MELETTNEYFDKRLKEINEEMESLLEKTNKQREQLQREAHSYQASKPAPYDYAMDVSDKPLSAGCSAALLAGTPTAGPVEQALVEQEVRKLCAAQVAKWIDTNLSAALEPILQSKITSQLKDINESLQHVRGKQDELMSEVKTVQDEWKQYKTNLQKNLNEKERVNQSQLGQFKDGVEQRLTEWRGEMNIGLDSVAGLKNKFDLSEKRVERRLEEAVNRQQEQIRSSIVDVEAQVFAWKSELRHCVSKDLEEIKMQRDALESQLGRLEGLISTTSEMSTRHAVILKELMEDSVERRSEVRLCRRDVNRMDMLVQCVGIGVPAERGGSGAPASNEGPVPLLMQELFKTKERVHIIASHLESVERYMHQMEDRFRRGLSSAARQGPPMAQPVQEEPAAPNGFSQRSPSSWSQQPVSAPRGGNVSSGASETSSPIFNKTHIPLKKDIPKENLTPRSPQRRPPPQVVAAEEYVSDRDKSNASLHSSKSGKTPSEQRRRSSKGSAVGNSTTQHSAKVDGSAAGSPMSLKSPVGFYDIDGSESAKNSPVDSYVSKKDSPADSYVSEKKSPVDSYVSENNDSYVSETGPS